MKVNTAVTLLAALAQHSRLTVFRFLVQKGPEGTAAGDIADRLGISPTSLSFHLKEMTHAGLIKSRKEGRFIYYSPDFKVMNALLSYLTENCCVGGPPKADCATLAICKET